MSEQLPAILSALPQHVSEYTREQLSPFLREKSPALLDEEITTLFKENIDGEMFIDLTDQALEKMGITTGSRMRILKLIAQGLFLFVLSSFILLHSSFSSSSFLCLFLLISPSISQNAAGFLPHLLLNQPIPFCCPLLSMIRLPLTQLCHQSASVAEVKR